MKVLPCHTIRRAEQELFDSGAMSSDELMDIAIDSAVEQLARDAALAHACTRFERVVVYIGKGNNAGDAIGIARRLGFSHVALRCAAPLHELSPPTRRQLSLLPPDRREPLKTPPTPRHPAEALLLIDGLLGSGAHGSLRPEYAALTEEMNTLRATHPNCTLLAVDIPSGLDAEHGAVHSPIVQADATLAIGCVKPGMLADGAEDFVGRIICVPLPEAVRLPHTAVQMLDASTPTWLPRRPYSFFKNRAGRVRIIAGSPGYIGAAQMCAEAALAAGAGLVELFCHPEIYPTLAARIAPEVMVRCVSSYELVPTEGADALLIGPGLGRPDAANSAALRRMVEAPPCPLVLDADGLNLAAAEGWRISPRCILTPHPGEMRRLFPEGAQLSRAECAARYVAERPCTLLLKGARTIITDGVSTYYNGSGGPYMANGGQGDVLSGVIAALAAQGMSSLRAAALGAYSCGCAADRAHRTHSLAVGATQTLRHLFLAP